MKNSDKYGIIIIEEALSILVAASYQTLSNIYSDVRYLANKDSTTLEDADLLRIANKYYLWIARELIDLNEDLYAEISYTDLVANQKEYPLPVDDTTGSGANSTVYGGGLVKLQRVEINYDGTSNGWEVAQPMGWQEIYSPTITNADINDAFDQVRPHYAFKDRSLFIAPVPTSSDSVSAGNAGLYIYWIKRRNEMTSSSNIPDIPKDFLSVLAEGMLSDIYRKYGRNSDAQLALRNFEAGIAKMRELAQSPDVEQPLVFKRLRENYR